MGVQKKKLIEFFLLSTFLKLHAEVLTLCTCNQKNTVETLHAG